MAMAGADGPADRSLIALLAREPYRFELRQAVRLLELLACRTAPHQTGMPPDILPLGAGSDPRREAVRLRGSLRSSFPSGEIEAPDRFTGEDRDPATAEGRPDRPTLTVSFFSLGGGFGPLPPPLTARLVERSRRRDHAARDFLDLFNHRLIALLLRQQRLFHPALQPSPSQPPAAQALPARLPPLALLGLATRPPGPGGTIAEDRTAFLLGAAGLLNQRPVSGHALEQLLQARLGLKVRLEGLCGGWLDLACEQRLRLGHSSRLGQAAVLGGRVWDQAAGIRIEIGPMSLERLRTLLPGGAGHGDLAALVHFALGDAFDVALSLTLLAQDVPRGLPLGRARPLLGWTSWLGQLAPSGARVVPLRLQTGQARRA